MNLDDLTIGEIKQINALLNNGATATGETINCHIGQKVIIRTYSAGVWFGELDQKAGKEVILKSARRMWSWKAKKSISLSGVAKYGIDHDDIKICPAMDGVWLEAIYGIDHDDIKICPAMDGVWLEAIEILPCTKKAIESIESAEDVEAE